MSAPDLIAQIAGALGRTGAATSDFDLNPETVLPEGRMLRPAGVLVPLLTTSNGPRILLTQRSSALKQHPGQIAFPGGKQDEGDADVTAAALREAQEEIGLDPSNVEVLGHLPVHETVTGYVVTPVIARVRAPFTPIPEAGEVAEVFDVPLPHLLDPKMFQIEGRYWRGTLRRYYAVPYGPYYIWGATARMLRALADVAGP
ncbi:ADP-ribose pyrophosphatase YjhB, NUDIX family [Roseovarius nanhaiticus]|uniref:ADP-ribose pyrophosphatase YjhB, NUDIX family n=1 Tax=Roseovarius nanhaiticus TaxID=573024 RepID=A0A1N7EI82_9RHOB|nr:CoA pyrophosphatase [Roseovarius nanhaiticus]SEK73952.1 ADP-ribose pyrophosphatase YjhB, NUDIX family [Roseovarius nanhaiticus]SIR87873.1 ADP-ribose pyrophosphatase YjhB, NUDIX family [Roseovarius nanhaiticus]